MRTFHYSSFFPFAVAVAGCVSGTIDRTMASPLSDNAFESLATRCAPSVPPQTLRAVGLFESRLDPLALHDNTTGISEIPESAEEALFDATTWIDHGDSVDIGLMQINSANLPALQMTPSEALDPCGSLAGGAAVLRAAYGGSKPIAGDQVDLLLALSRYNTGSPIRGIMNGYARRVLANAGNVQLAISKSQASAELPPDLDAPPPWNISATGAYAQVHGATWLVPLNGPVAVGTVPANPPRTMHTPSRQVAGVPTDHPPINQ